MTPISNAYVFTHIRGEPVPLGVVKALDGQYFFAYAKSWRSRPEAYAIDPLHLPLTDETFISSRIFDVLLDAGPDNWGKRVMAATHTQLPRNPIEELIACRGSGAGNLLFSASRNRVLPPRVAPTFGDLSDLIRGSDAVERRQPVDDERLAKMLSYGSSMGGARPKVVVTHEGREWIAKLNRNDDTFDNAKAEAACLTLARDLGMSVPRTQLHEVEGRSVLLVERFDRDGELGRMHYISAQAVLGTHRISEKSFYQDYSYPGLAMALRRFAASPWEDAQELFARMLLNVGVHNTDDHLRNHGFLLDPSDPDAGYRLSPLFDVLPHLGVDQHAIGLGQQGRASTFSNALSEFRRFGLSGEQAREIFTRVSDGLARLHDNFKNVGLSEPDAALLRSRIQRYYHSLNEMMPCESS